MYHADDAQNLRDCGCGAGFDRLDPQLQAGIYRREITLRGKVLPVGGIKEKVLAAHRAGIRTILLPRENEADIEEIPQSVRKQLTFHLLDKAKEALEYAMVKDSE